MKLRKIISGGQSGADRTGLECAKELGLETGGTAPKEYRTEYGPDPSLKDFGLLESAYRDYKVRTKDNVRNADATLWFGNTGSPGYHCTHRYTHALDKPFHINPSAEDMRRYADMYEVINIAGNRESTNPAVVEMVREAFRSLQR